jgi:hypothetical protein
MTTCDQNNLLHLHDSQSKPSGESEPTVDMFDYPLAEVSPRKCVLTLSIHWKI